MKARIEIENMSTEHIVSRMTEYGTRQEIIDVAQMEIDGLAEVFPDSYIANIDFIEKNLLVDQEELFSK